jgi:hypothetical protein
MKKSKKLVYSTAGRVLRFYRKLWSHRHKVSKCRWVAGIEKRKDDRYDEKDRLQNMDWRQKGVYSSYTHISYVCKNSSPAMMNGLPFISASTRFILGGGCFTLTLAFMCLLIFMLNE